MKEKNRKITELMALLVFVVFALCVLLVLLTGAKVYRRLADRSEEQYLARTAAQYVATRVRQSEGAAVEDFHGCPCLVLQETVEGETYLTRVYSYGGHLRELYSTPDAALYPEDGERVLEGVQLQFSLEGNLLTVDTGSSRFRLYLRTGNEVGS